MKTNYKVEKEMTFPLTFKSIDDAGKFEGYASTFGNKDQQGDVVVKGAFKKTIDLRKGKWPILWQHDSRVPVGVNIFAEEDEKGLKVAGEINVDSPDGEKAYKWAKFSMERDLPVGLSIGFRIRDKEDKDGIRYLKEIQLVEYSIVTFPANEEAGLTTVKSITEETIEKAMDFNEALQQEMTERDLCELRWTIQSAMSDALCSVQDDDTLTVDDQLALMKTIYDQYATAMLAWWAKWLNYMAANEEPDDDADEGQSSIEGALTKEGAKTKKVAGVDLPAHCFAYVGDPNKVGTWKLPIEFPGDREKTINHIRLALAMFSRTQGIPTDKRAEVLAKIHAAAKAYGIDSGKEYDILVEELKAGAAISAKTKKTLVGAMDYHKQAVEMHKSADKLHAKGSAMLSNLIGQASQKDAGDPPKPPVAPVVVPTPIPVSPAPTDKSAEEKLELLSALKAITKAVQL